ncbi:MAG: glycosyltransferase family 4 protein [Bacteroidota bacterium]
MPKILFIGAHRLNRSPSQRFRFEQYFSFLERNGFECHLSYLLSEADDRIFYSEGNFIKKVSVVVKSFLRRRKDISKAKEYDIIFIQREAFMTGSVYFEKQLKKTGKKIVFDFDDAVWLPNVSEGNRKFEWMKNFAKTKTIIELSDSVIAGNNFLADYAGRFTKNTIVIPTTIDTSYHQKQVFSKDDVKICIGWTGSHTTIRHFEHAIPVLKKLKEKFPDKIYFKVIGDNTFENKELCIKGVLWKLENEISELSEFDIGIMPLPDDEWAKGKCGLKGLQYMSLEIPTVMSPVGVNNEIISDGVNGFLAGNESEWIEKISLLIENPEVRKKIGTEARKTVEDNYSVNSQKENYLNVLKSLLR